MSSDELSLNLNHRFNSAQERIEALENQILNLFIENSDSDSDSDDVIFVSQFNNPNPVVIDLCEESVIGPQTEPTQPATQNQLKASSSKDGSSTESEKNVLNETLTIMRCPICLECATKNEPMSTICGHIFCKQCIFRSLHENLKCPICKKNLTLNKVHPLYLSSS